MVDGPEGNQSAGSRHDGDRTPLTAVGIRADLQPSYEALLAESAADPERLSAALGISVGEATEQLAALQAAGLAIASDPTSGRYTAADPHNALMPKLLAREAQLALTRQRLLRLAVRHASRATAAYTGVTVVQGRSDVLDLHRDMLDSIEETYSGVDAPPHLGNPLEAEPAVFAALRRGVLFRTLYDRRSLDVPDRLADLEDGIRAGEDARVGDTPLKLSIVDERVAAAFSYRSDGTPYAVSVSEPVLVAALAALFEAFWEAATPLRITDQGPRRDSQPDSTDQRLLTMLAAGHTDAEIGAALEWSDRRVRRRIAAMYERLDATSRFQAGYQAYVRGWLSP